MASAIRNISINKDKGFFWSASYKLMHFIHNVVIRTAPTKAYLKFLYKYNIGKKLNLAHPKTLTEKLQWKKVYDRNPLYTLCQDKYKVRDYIKKKIGEKYLVPLLYTTTNPDSINFNQLPNQFIIKANHGSGWNIIVKDKRKIDDKYKEEIIKRCKKWLKSNYYYIEREWQYKYIKPRIIIEKLLLDEKGKIPTDYKFHCFNGKVEFIQVDFDRFEDHKAGILYSNWKPAPFTVAPRINGKPVSENVKGIPKPSTLKEMVKISEILSKEFNHIRVDLYSIGKKVYFGEFTFSAGGGYAYFVPQKYDLIYGDKIKIKK